MQITNTSYTTLADLASTYSSLLGSSASPTTGSATGSDSATFSADALQALEQLLQGGQPGTATTPATDLPLTGALGGTSTANASGSPSGSSTTPNLSSVLLHALGALAQADAAGSGSSSSSTPAVSQQQLTQISNAIQQSDPSLFAQLDADGGSTLSLSDLQNGRSAINAALQQANPQLFAQRTPAARASSPIPRSRTASPS